MHFPDNSEYCYLKNHRSAVGFFNKKTVNIAWLDAAHPFPVGDVSEAILDRLFLLCANPPQEFRTRGFHRCDFCEDKPMGGVSHERNGKKLIAGSAEIRVPAKAVTYAAPNMIYHYVMLHHYLPPTDFIEAIASLSDQELEKLINGNRRS